VQYVRPNHSAFRGGKRTGSPYRKGRRRGRKVESFLTTIVGLSAVAFVATWQATPVMQSIYSHATRTPEEIASVEQSAYYQNCSDARARGAAPIYSGQPGYRAEMDGDSDGVACEPYRY
jgi:hypothetical protein